MKAYRFLSIILVSLFIGNLFPQERVIDLDLNKVQGNFNSMFKECVGAGRANEGLRAVWQQ